MNTTLKYKGVEILCKPGSVLKYRDGKLGVDKVLVTDQIYKNIARGDIPKQFELENLFGNISRKEMMHQILTESDYSLNTLERKELLNTKRVEIIQYIHKYYTDSKNKPIPVTRIELALDKIKPKININERLEKQAQPIIKKMRELIPMVKTEEMRGIFEVPHSYIGATKITIVKWGLIESEFYGKTHASFKVVFIPGNYDLLIADLNNKTNGCYTFDLEE